MNLYMMCRAIMPGAFSPIPEGHAVRALKPEELGLWLAFPFDSDEEAAQHQGDMLAYYNRVYAPRAAEFFQACKLLCDPSGTPLATAFLWRSYEGRMLTLHWLKTRKAAEGRGLGRALLSHVLGGLTAADAPLYLHTHPECVAAIKLYTDFGFELIKGPVAGCRSNDLAAGLAALQKEMRPEAFRQLKVCQAPPEFYTIAAREAAEF